MKKVNWQNSRLKEIADYVDYRGKTPCKSKSGKQLITARNIKEGYIDYNISKEYVNESEYDKIMSRGLPGLGDILITTEAPMGNVAQVDNVNIALAQRVIKYRCKENTILNDYLKYYLMSDIFKRQLKLESTGGTVKGIKGSRLHNIHVFYPEIDVQKGIVDILKVFDIYIEKTERLIRAKEEYKKGLMQKLLSGNLRFNGKWKNEQIKKIARIKKGEQLNRLKLSDKDEYPALNGGIMPSGFTNKWNTEGHTITISEGGNSCGFINFMTTKFWSGGHCYSLLDVKINTLFLYYALKHREKQIMRLRVGSGLPNIQKTDIEDFLVPIPDSIEEQNRIAEMLSLIDKEINLLKQKAELLKLQKKGLMQQLLTGKLRVKTKGEK